MEEGRMEEWKNRRNVNEPIVEILAKISGDLRPTPESRAWEPSSWDHPKGSPE